LETRSWALRISPWRVLHDEGFSFRQEWVSVPEICSDIMWILRLLLRLREIKTF
jgi:hypothetical protein